MWYRRENSVKNEGGEGGGQYIVNNKVNNEKQKQEREVWYTHSSKSALPNTGYSFWDRLHNFSNKFTWIVLSVQKLNKLGKFW